MFLKLMKHELKATGRIQGILAASSLGVSLLGTLLLYLAQTLQGENLAVEILSILLFPTVLLSLVGCSAASWILVCYRFYRNKFTDEGYLTFTLPVTADQLIWSSYLTMLLWGLVSTLVLLGGVMLFLGTAIQTALEGEMSVFQLMQVIWENTLGLQLADPEISSYMGLSAASAVIGNLAGFLSVMMAIALGCAAAKKHKLLASFGIAYGINVLVGTLQSTVTLTVGASLGLSGVGAPLWIGPAFQLVVSLALGLISYLTLRHLMGKKLNLN